MREVVRAQREKYARRSTALRRAVGCRVQLQPRQRGRKSQTGSGKAKVGPPGGSSSSVELLGREDDGLEDGLRLGCWLPGSP